MAGEITYKTAETTSADSNQATSSAVPNLYPGTDWTNWGNYLGQLFGGFPGGVIQGASEGMSQGWVNVGAGIGTAGAEALGGLGVGMRSFFQQTGMGIGEGAQGAFQKIFPIVMIGAVIFIIILVVKQA